MLEELRQKMAEARGTPRQVVAQMQALMEQQLRSVRPPTLSAMPFVPEVAERLRSLHEQWQPEALGKSFAELPFLSILKERYDEQNQVKLLKYLTRVCDSAGVKMLEDEDFANLFLQKDEFQAVILSVDIRRSTQLMLTCRSPQIYAEFINTLTDELTQSVKNRYGIYDKFTGDGLLSFFPDFYSGEEAILYAVQCALDFQEIFGLVFSSYKQYFSLDADVTGVGVGIDSGRVFKAGAELEYTVVGSPVVYACRFSAAPAGHVYLTEGAARLFEPVNRGTFAVTKTSIPIKHESDQTAFDVRPLPDAGRERLYIKKPSWCETERTIL